jgi:hypothetical protein
MCVDAYQEEHHGKQHETGTQKGRASRCNPTIAPYPKVTFVDKRQRYVLGYNEDWGGND